MASRRSRAASGDRAVRTRLALLVLAASRVLAGCSASGLDAKTSFACKAPDGVTCMSVSGVYETSRQNALPGQQPASSSAGSGAEPPASAPQSTRTSAGTEGAPGTRRPPLTSGTPLRSAPRVLRIWLAPYEDSEGDLRDQTHIYVTLDRGAWQIEHTRRAIQDRFAPIRAVIPATPSAASPGVRAGESDGPRPQAARPADTTPIVPGVPPNRPGSE
jgi:conjugal transfer pilus assembly protein TraV